MCLYGLVVVLSWCFYYLMADLVFLALRLAMISQSVMDFLGQDGYLVG